MNKQSQYVVDGIKHATINGHRFHLRLTDPTEENFLWIDGKQPPLILDQVAADFIGHMIDAMWKFQQGSGDESNAVVSYVVQKMYEQYGTRVISLGKNRVTKERLKADFHRIYGTLMGIANGACPHEMGLDPKVFEYKTLGAPARMDLAVTYRCNLNCTKCLNEKYSNFPELPTETWEGIYETLWKIGVPQLVFTGGCPLMRKDIVHLIGKADKFVTGLITNGTLLAPIAEDLLSASLDYAQITIESKNPSVHDVMTMISGSHIKTVQGIKRALAVGLQVVTNTTVTKTNKNEFLDTVQWIIDLGVKNIACNTLICSGRGTSCKMENGVSDSEMYTLLERAQILADLSDANFQWYSPTCYTQGVNPISLNLGIKACSAAAHNMTIQPDGTVLPCQSWPESVGNILTDEWSSIWNHPTCVKLRNHEFKADECSGCSHVGTCGGGCPLDKSPRISDEGGVK